MYHDPSFGLSFATAGTQRLTINSAGTVGIPGTAVIGIANVAGTVSANEFDAASRIIVNGTTSDVTGIALLGAASASAARATISAAAATHTHDGADITSGQVAVARLGTGTPTASEYLRGDGTWTAVPGAGVGFAENGGFLDIPYVSAASGTYPEVVFSTASPSAAFGTATLGTDGITVNGAALCIYEIIIQLFVLRTSGTGAGAFTSSLNGVAQWLPGTTTVTTEDLVSPITYTYRYCTQLASGTRVGVAFTRGTSNTFDYFGNLTVKRIST